MIKIAFFDVDGTLLNTDTKVVTQTTIDTLKKLQANNIKIIVSTGRPYRVIPKFGDVTFDGYITFNGGYSFVGNDLIYKNPIPAIDVQKVIKNGERIGRPVLLMCMDSNGANGCDDDLKDYMWVSKQGVDIPDNFEEYSKQDVYQIIVGCTKAEEQELIKDAEGVKITSWWPRAGDIIPKEAGKGTSVKKMLEYFGYTKEESIAFGDGTNDVEMLLAVGKGIAMENSTDALKAVADEICPHVREEGVYQYCKKEGLI